MTDKELEAVMERHTPAGYDPAGDDMTIPFAVKLAEQDKLIAQMRELLSLICRTDRAYEVFDCPSGGAIRLDLQRILADAR
jgi:hypothetical protein